MALCREHCKCFDLEQVQIYSPTGAACFVGDVLVSSNPAFYDEMSSTLDAHAKPPVVIRTAYKQLHKLQRVALENDAHLISLTSDPWKFEPIVRPVDFNGLPTDLLQVFQAFLGGLATRKTNESYQLKRPSVYEVTSVPGLYIFPSLLPPEVQLELLERIFHRDLSQPEHQTNVHLHYHVPYPDERKDGTRGSYFDSSASDLRLEPKDPNVHKPFTTQQYLNKKLRWMTLGGQYDWTNKVYPTGAPPPFPSDVKNLLESLFPMKAEAAIVNLYSPGDTLSLHRDVSEECSQPLVSISLGCDGIFIAGLEADNDDGITSVAAMRLSSGDAVLMSGKSRYAWHGVPKVLENTCPDWMQDWPYQCNQFGGHEDRERRFEQWRGWMAAKRINLNVRQMFN